MMAMTPSDTPTTIPMNAGMSIPGIAIACYENSSLSKNEIGEVEFVRLDWLLQEGSPRK